MKTIQYIRIVIGLVLVVVVIACVLWLKSAFKGNYLELGSSDAIEPTPTQIQSIRDIGEWEFLSITAEEMVDTVRKGFFSDDELVRIYYGTLRLGVDLKQLSPEAITMRGDTVQVVLPPVGLLDQDFIDEAKTKPFYESGSWSSRDHELLYRKARAQMLRNCLTSENIASAQSNGEVQFRNFMQSFGYKNVSISFAKENKTNY